jgi:signal transduction histidine kinase
MKPFIADDQVLNTNVTSANYRKAFAILFIALLLTVSAVIYTKNRIEILTKNEFALVCNEIKVKIDTRLHAHALLLRSSSSFYSASDSISRLKWKQFIDKSQLNKNLRGIQGVGFSLIIPKKKLKSLVQTIRSEGFPDFTVKPAGDRDIFTSIIYLEPFSGRNLRAFGYDMYSEPVRRNAMEISRDEDVASLSGKVMLVQETGDDLQAGTLMYVPVYRNGMPAHTVVERRAAIIGWVYSPYRMNDLMNGILGTRDSEDISRMQLQIFDGDRITAASLLFDSKKNNSAFNENLSNESLSLPIDFNGKTWTLHFTPAKVRSILFQSEVFLVFFSGIVISFLLFSLTLSLYNTRYRARAIAGHLTFQLEKRDHFLQEEQVKLRLANEAINTLNETLEVRIAERTRQFEASNKELVFRLSEIEQLTYIAAHDLQEPLLTLTNFTNLLKEEYAEKLEDEGNQYIGFISRSAGRMKELVRGMLDYSLLGKEAELTIVDCNTIIGEVQADLAASIGACNASISVQLLPTINCYPTEMRLLFQNLVNNAIKFRRAEVLPAIKISVEPFETGWKFTIADNGIGIEKKNLEKVFAIFKRLHNRSEYEGTGIGLAHCKKIVELHRGKIWVESVPEKGSRFIFTIPGL